MNMMISYQELVRTFLKLIDVPEDGGEPASLIFAAVQTLLSPVIDELDKAMAIHENNKAPHTGE